MAVNILVIENELATQELLVLNLAQCGFRPTHVKDPRSAIKTIHSSLPNLILLGSTEPEMSGFELLRRIKADQRARNIPIIIISAYTSEHGRVTGLDSGADDYVTKPFLPRELMARVRAVLRRQPANSCLEILEIGGLALSSETHRVTANGTPIELGAVDFRLLHFFMTHTERVHSRAQLIEYVWLESFNTNVNDRTVDVHINSLRQILKPYGLDVLVQTVRGFGYKFVTCAI